MRLPRINKTFIKRNIFSILLTSVFFVVCYLGILRHEMWRDELQSWMIARDAHSVTDIFRAIRYEGHPCLWYLVLFVITRFTSDPFAMQILHLLIATGVVYFFARFSPFTKLQKTLFAFGYFPLYEYGIKARSYSLGVLLMFIFCSVYPHRYRKYLLLSIILFLLCQVNPFGLIVAVCLGATLLVEVFFNSGEANWTKNKRSIILASLVTIAGVLFVLIQIFPPRDVGYKGDLYLDATSKKVLSTVVSFLQSYLPDSVKWIPESTRILRSFGIKFGSLNHFVSYSFFIVVFFLSLFLFIRKPIVLLFYSLSTLGLLLATYLRRGVAIWHLGYLLIVFFVSLWLSHCYKEMDIKPSFAMKASRFVRKLKNLFVYSILFTQFHLAIIYYVDDWHKPYSAAKETASFIKSQGLDRLRMIGYVDVFVSTVSGYLNKPLYYCAINNFGTYVVWSKKIIHPLVRKTPLESAMKLMEENQQDILLILSYKLKTEYIPTNFPYSVEKVAQFTKSMVGYEIFYLYLVKYKK